MGKYAGLYKLVLEVSDIEEATAFYRNLLGMAVLQDAYPGDADAVRQVTLDAGNGTEIVLWMSQERAPGEASNAHIQFAILIDADELLALRQRLGEYGVPVKADIGPAIYCEDPDGNIVEMAAIGSDWLEPTGAIQVVTEEDEEAP